MNSSTPNSWIGRSIGDRQRYRLEKRLGMGGMGDVFLAMDTRIGKQVALKLLKDTLVASKEMRRRFEREVEVCAALDSDNIVKVSDYGVTDEGYPFYVMEYLRGETLRQFLQHDRPSLEQTVSIITQVCKGLQLAHKGVTLWREGATVSEHIQVVHRDLKPDNIFLVPTDSGKLVKIVDFGIAKIRNESAEQTNFTNAFIGTFRYAAPEQLRGEINLDGRADIYSLGIILYEMLSAADPFGFSIKSRNISEASWIFAHTGEPPKPLRSQPGCENLSSQLEAVVMRCLEKKPGDRFASVEELNLALRAAAESSAFDNLLEETIAQAQAWNNEGSDAETIARPLNPASESKREETIAQIPLANPVVEHKHEETIAQIPLANPVVEHKHEETIAQIPLANPVVEHKHEETIAQIPLASPAQPQREETIAQIPMKNAVPATEWLKKNPQLPAAKINIKQNVAKQTIFQKPKDSSSLKVIIAVTLFGVSCLGGFFAYPFITSQLALNKIKEAQTKANYEECINLSKYVTSDATIYPEVQEILNKCRVDYALKLAQRNQCPKAYKINEENPQSLLEKTKIKINNFCEVTDNF
ncbi:MAG: protein kinase [Cyanomargarita calcarea GSE-NOS-MK-12-04C]|jgi:serine/threonine-protein kinase|uniref:Protein kinase n=1 Tax=Cyanomargarita calcarea GSE-NOS-MK-12-04C TaxID=2839659 RepID=A0A951QSE5_9CYAN|nr:protein kinase [Cyanomargarita calcarea GSE-NOS-MK-12-04C]